MKTQDAPLVTAATLAASLAISRQAISKHISGIPPQTALIEGRAVAAWPFHALPVPLQKRLAVIAEQKGFPDAQAMLAGSGLSRQSKSTPDTVPFKDQPAPMQQRAIKLRAAQAATLARLDDTAITAVEREQRGLAEYKAQFGFAITPRHFRRLLTRTLKRAGADRDFSRLDLYTDAQPVTAKQRPHKAHFSHAILSDVLAQFENPAAPTADDRAHLWHNAFEHYENLLAENPGHPAQRAIKNSLLDWLFNAVPSLARSAKSHRRLFEIKLNAWHAGGCTIDALEDRRRLDSGNFRKQDFTEDHQKIRDTAILHGGSVSLAHRKLRQTGQLSAEFVSHYNFDPRRNKSYVPPAVRQAITPEIQMCGPIHRGPWQARMAGPYIPRDWSDVQPGQWFSGDDVTWNNYFYFYDEAGQVHIERGECLVLHDLRTGYILDYVLIAGKYNSRHIRKLILQVHDRHGLPHNGFYFERGVWKARIIQDIDSRQNLPWRETERGLAAYNLQVRHATTPRAKTIEGLFRILQERQRNEPGFVGFNERIDDVERMQDHLARCRRSTANPADKLLSMEQWTKRLDAIFAEFNHDPQNGKMLDGASPAEAWQSALDRQPLRKLPDDARYHLATHLQPATVRQQGITLTIGGNKMLYCNEQTGHLIGRQVLTYYNLDCPDLLTVSDLNRQNHFTVKAISLPALSATTQQFETVHAQIGGHRKAAKTIYGNIQHPTIASITRDNSASEPAKELGRFVNQQTETFQAQQTAVTRKLRKIQTTAAAAGIAIPGRIKNPERVMQGLELEAKARAKRAARIAPSMPSAEKGGEL